MVFDLDNDPRVNSYTLATKLKVISLRPSSNIEIYMSDSSIYIKGLYSADRVAEIPCYSKSDCIKLFNDFDIALSYDKNLNPEFFV